MNWLLRPYRIWRETRWFMKHWQVHREFARYCALRRVEYLEERARR